MSHGIALPNPLMALPTYGVFSVTDRSDGLANCDRFAPVVAFIARAPKFHPLPTALLAAFQPIRPMSARKAVLIALLGAVSHLDSGGGGAGTE